MMKKVCMLCLALTLCAGVVAAAPMQQKPATGKQASQIVTTVFSADIDCPHCAKKIENNVPSLGRGIKDVKVDVPQKEVTVTYDASKNDPETIIKGLASLKVKAQVKK